MTDTLDSVTDEDVRSVPERMQFYSQKIDQALRYLREQVEALADAEREYRIGKAAAWTNCTTGTVAEREAIVNGATAGLRHARDKADGLRQAALESVRARRTQLSALQSLLAAHREEAGMARYGAEQ